MSNKLTNDDSFQNYVGKYITLTQNGVKKKYYVSEINKASFLSNVSILQGTNNTDFSFTSAGTKQKCDICDDACIYNVPILQLNFRGIYPDNISTDRLVKSYYDEKHDLFINGKKVCTIDTSVLSAWENIIYVIISDNKNLQIDVNDVRDYLSTSSTTSFSSIYFDPLYYNFNGVNSFHTTPVYADNPNTYGEYSQPWSRSYPVPTNAFYTSFFATAAPTTCFIRKKILTNTNGTSSLGCVKWLCNDFGFHSFPSGFPYLQSDFVDGYESSYRSNSCIFYDMNPCSNPNNYIEGFIYNTEEYYSYTNQTPSLSSGIYNYYPSYHRNNYTPVSAFGGPEYYTRTVYYSSTTFTQNNKVITYAPSWENMIYSPNAVYNEWTEYQKDNVVPSIYSEVYLDYGMTPYTGTLYYVDLTQGNGVLKYISCDNGVITLQGDV